MNWTAKQVWELVKDWPEEAWTPFWFGYTESHTDGPTFYEQCGPIMPTTAMYVLMGCGLEWLAKQRTYAICGTRVYTGNYDSPLREWDIFDGRTLFEAVSAAVLAAKGGGNG